MHRLASLARGAALALALALAGVSGGALADGARPRFTWPNPGMIDDFEVPGVMKVLGMPIRLRGLRVRLPLQQIMETYADAFARAGFYLPPRSHLGNIPQPTLVALDVDRLIAYAVIFEPHADGTTTLLLGEANVGLMDKQGESLAPLFPGAQGVMRSDQEDAQVLVFEAKAKPAEVQSFYREVLGKAGFTEAEPSRAPGLFTRKGEQLQLVANTREGGRVSVALIHRLRQAEGREDLGMGTR